MLARKFLNPYFFILLIIASVAFVSCENTKRPLEEYGPFFENVMRSENGVFRGFSLGATIDSVIKSEPGKAKETDAEYLYYVYSADTLGTYNISYSFTELGLSEIHSDLYINNQTNTDHIFESFKAYFDEHYGPSETDMGYTVWSIKSDKFFEVKINLSNESSDFSVPNSPGKISIWIYPDKQ